MEIQKMIKEQKDNWENTKRLLEGMFFLKRKKKGYRISVDVNEKGTYFHLWAPLFYERYPIIRTIRPIQSILVPFKFERKPKPF